MNEKFTKPLSRDDIKKIPSQTDWDHLRAQSNENSQDDFEIDWNAAQVVMPEPKKMISIRLDQDVIDYFRAQGHGYQTRMNAVLRSYIDAHTKAG